MNKTLGRISEEAYMNAVAKGWWESDRSIGELLALIHSEVSEALEDYRKDKMKTYLNDNGKPCGFPSELADIIIRVCDLSCHLGIDIENEVLQKMKYNKTRPYRHGGKKC